MVNEQPKGEMMAKIYCSFSDGDIYILHDNCDLKTLMDEQAGYNGVLICVSKGVFEMVEYVDGEESGFTTRVNPKTSKPLSGTMFDMYKVERIATRVKPKTSEPSSGIMFDMDKAANDFFEYVSTVTGEKC